MIRSRFWLDNREHQHLGAVSDHHFILIDEIRAILAAPASGTHAPSLSQIEHTLTSGYAHALALEAERSRIERRLGEVAAHAGDGHEQTQEIAALGQRLTNAHGELSTLRLLLDSLRTRASDVRARVA
jgi:hypothetical protein